MWVLPPPDPDNPFGSFVIDSFGAHGLKVPRATVVSTGIEMRANLLRGGQYVSIFPEFWLQLPVRHPFIKKLPVELPVVSGPIGIGTLTKRTPNPVVQRFMQCAREVAKSLTRIDQ
jgi:DNA-binding transcriptional LysR family regulator